MATQRALVGALLLACIAAGIAWWLARPKRGLPALPLLVLTPDMEKRTAAIAGSEFRECAHCPAMVVLPAGKFLMGSPSGQGTADEQPQHEVAIARPFAAGKFEVTFDEWDRCAAEKACVSAADSDWGRGQRPVINVTWADAKQYVAWLARLTGKPYRLFSEAEWEYAARAGSTALYSFGDDPVGLVEHGWFATNSNSRTQPVGQKRPNAFGLHDMYGNVWEWVEDVWHPSYDGAPSDGRAWSDGDDAHVVRGGSWNYGPDSLRSASRNGFGPLSRGYLVGIRVARSLNP
jgi:formylglycine-generating enzyme required for sulfatase activity